MNTRFGIIVLLLLFQCSIDRTITDLSDYEKSKLVEFLRLTSYNRVVIADEQEEGERLLLCLTFVDKAKQEVLPHQVVQFYHTSNEGKYEPSDPAYESTARLNGMSSTNEEGRIYVETILPGNYGNAEDNRHIHMTVVDATPYAYDIHFKQYSGRMSRRFIKRSDQHFLANLRKTEEGELIAFVTIEVKNPSPNRFTPNSR